SPDRDPACGRSGHGVKEKITGNCALLFVMLASCGTGCTFTFTYVRTPNTPVVSMLRKMTDFVSPALMTLIVCLRTSGEPCFWIVSVTGILLSRLSPVFFTSTWNARLVDATTVLSLVEERIVPLGSAFTSTMPVPCNPADVPLVDAPFTLLNSAA